MSENEQFYVRYYSGHNGRFGHEFLGTPPLPYLPSLPLPNGRLLDVGGLRDGWTSRVVWRGVLTGGPL
jgi:hypothetical protein